MVCFRYYMPTYCLTGALKPVPHTRKLHKYTPHDRNFLAQVDSLHSLPAKSWGSTRVDSDKCRHCRVQMCALAATLFLILHDSHFAPYFMPQTPQSPARLRLHARAALLCRIGGCKMPTFAVSALFHAIMQERRDFADYWSMDRRHLQPSASPSHLGHLPRPPFIPIRRSNDAIALRRNSMLTPQLPEAPLVVSRMSRAEATRPLHGERRQASRAMRFRMRRKELQSL